MFCRDLENGINENQRRIQEFEIIKVKLKDIDEKKKRILELENLNESIGKDLVLLEDQIRILEDSVFGLKKFENIFFSARYTTSYQEFTEK